MACGQGLHGVLRVIVVEVVVEIQDVAGGVAQPGEGLAMRDMVVGTEAGEVVAEAVHLVAMAQADLDARRLEPLKERACAELGQDPVARPRQAVKDRPHAWMDRDEALVLVLGGFARPTAADVEHAQVALVQEDVPPLQLLELADSHPGVGEDREGRVRGARDVAQEQLHLFGFEARLGLGPGLGEFGRGQGVGGQQLPLPSPLEDLLAQGQRGVDGLGGVGDTLLVPPLLQPASEPVELGLPEAIGPFDAGLAGELPELVKFGLVLGQALGGEVLGPHMLLVLIDDLERRESLGRDAFPSLVQALLDLDRFAAGLATIGGGQAVGDPSPVEGLVDGRVGLAGLLAPLAVNDPELDAVADLDLGAVNALGIDELHGRAP